ncbi:PD-(D/E)XK motif protein [Actinopolymorpha sp. B9G3]|uniref:PD-(D/E)XK motif protein n=1 Tax=Actinopolymorpha sp. B9G3 TaxID=3158970 RepID=UPI0032D9085A
MTGAADGLNVRLTAETLGTYFRSGSIVPLSLATTPPCTLRIDAPSERLELWTPAAGPEPDVSTLNRVSISTEDLDDGLWFVLTVDARGAHLEAYSLLAAVVDDLAAGRTFHMAVARSLASFRDLLAGRGRLSQERTLGLIGELLVLEHLLSVCDEGSSVRAWLGPHAAEHDFVLADLDAEVKTTLSERRSHVIGSETQLQPSATRPLWLVSIQLTRAGAATEAFTLPSLITRVRARLATSEAVMDAHLGRLGWRDSDVDLYLERYMPRTRPRAYLVDDGFPAITRTRLGAVVPRVELVGPVSYRLDVTGLSAGVPPGVLGGFVEGGSA